MSGDERRSGMEKQDARAGGPSEKEESVDPKEALERRTSELAQALAMMRATLEATTDGILVTDRRGGVTGYNDRLLSMWKLPTEVVSSRDHERILDAMSRACRCPRELLCRVEEIERKAPRETFDVIELADGRFIERVSRIQCVAERNVGRVWSFVDITEQRRSEIALQEETRILELLHRTGRTIASELDLRSLVQATVNAATQLSGARWGALTYRLPGEQGEALECCALAAPGAGEPATITWPTLRGEGVMRSTDVLADARCEAAPATSAETSVRSYLSAPVYSRSGGRIGNLLLGHPEIGAFSERDERLVAGVASQAAVAMDNARLYDHVRRLAHERESLLEAERAARADAERGSVMKDEFLANVSHELRTPLNAILGWAQLIASGRIKDAELKQGVEIIARNARVQAQLIEDLLDMSRIISGKVRLEIQQTDLAAVVVQALDTVRPSAEAKRIRLRQVIDHGVELIWADAARVQQIVWNLASNAVKFTPAGGLVEVRVRPTNAHFEIAVSDTGAGIPRELLPHVFERFRQADASTIRTQSGLGLGLAIVKQLVELHGGAVSAHSEGPDQGATFVVSLPRIPPDPNRPAPPRTLSVIGSVPETPMVDLSGVRIVVVEDEPDARALISRVLESCNAEVTAASSAATGLELVRARLPHVIISDIGMPHVDGYEFIREVRRLPASRGGDVPALALTAFARSEDRTRAMLAGYQMHIAKPIELRELVATVASFAGRAGSSG